jgi:hypothetical protein
MAFAGLHGVISQNWNSFSLAAEYGEIRNSDQNETAKKFTFSVVSF